MTIVTKKVSHVRKTLGLALLGIGCLFILREFFGNAGAPNILTGLLMMVLGVLNILRPRNRPAEGRD